MQCKIPSMISFKNSLQQGWQCGIFNWERVFGKEWGNIGFEVFVLKPGEDFIGSVNLCKDLGLKGVNLFLFCCDTGGSVLKGFEIGMPFWGTEEVDVSALVWASQKLKEVVNGEHLARGCSQVNGRDLGFRGSFRLR